RSLRRARNAAPRRRDVVVHCGEAQGAGRRAGAFARAGHRGTSLARVGGLGGGAAHARRDLPLEPREGPLLGAAADRARVRSGLRSPARRSLPPRHHLPALAARQAAAGVPLRSARRDGGGGAPADFREGCLATVPARKELIQIEGREVAVSNPEKVFFSQGGITKLDLVRYYLAVAPGALRGAGGRPMALKRYVNGAEGEFFFQKRAPEARPLWIEVVELKFPSGRTAREIVLRDAAQLAWIINLGCIDLHPHPVRAEDLDHPDELRVDLDPQPGVPWDDVRRVALLAREVLGEHGLTGFPKTSGSRGIHVNVRIQQRWTFQEVRAAALALAREVERRAPQLATSKWWKEERHGVFIDYNQNAKDRTVASAYSVRPTPDARVSTPLGWDEVPSVEPEAFTLQTVP